MWRTNLRNILNKNSEIDFFGDLTDVSKERNKIVKILKNYSTPIFLADQQVLEKRLSDLRKSCRKNWRNFQIAYSFKTNYEIGKLKTIRKYGLWAEVVSGWEYRMAKRLGYKGQEIVFNGPSKTDSDLKVALRDGALVFADNPEELERIGKIAKLEKKEFQIGIRLRSKIPKISQGRFGFSVNNDEAFSALLLINKDPLIKLVGLHMHIGSDIDNPERYKDAASSLVGFIQKNNFIFKDKIRFLDFGGGFPSHSLAPFGRLRWNPKPIENYVDAISGELNRVFKDKKPTIILEPGRYLVDDAVFFVTKITSCKNAESNQVLTTDATITMLPLVQYRRQMVKLYDKDLGEKKSNPLKTVVYGASCRENDVLHRGKMPRAEVGDILIFFVTGAYNQNMSSEFIFTKPECISL